MNACKLLTLSGTLAASLIGSGVALAANSSTPVGFTLADWINFGYNTSPDTYPFPGAPAVAPGIVRDEDKVWTYISHTPALDDVLVTIQTFTDNPMFGVDTHQQIIQGTPTPPWSGTLEYSLAIAPYSIAEGNTLRNASIGADVPAANPGVTITKSYFSDSGFTTLLATLVSINGSGATTTAVAPLTAVWVRETIVVGPGGILNSVSDTFTENVPEPTTLALFGLGLAGLGARARSRKAAT